MKPRRVIVAISGASGAIYGIRTLQVLQPLPDVESHLVISSAGRQTIALETDLSPRDVENMADVSHAIGNVAAPISSGSFRTEGMLVAPCSMKTLSAIAYSMSDSLMTRAADVILKERRRLVLMTRETPVHLGHLRAMVQVTEMGGIVMPAMPAFYHLPRTVDDVVNQTVNRALDLLGIDLPGDLFDRWRGARPAPTLSE